MKAFIFGIIVAVIAIAAGVYFYFDTGSAPVATSAQAMPFEKMLAKKGLHARVEKEMPKTVPITADASAYAAGAQVYRDNCAVCHGLPKQPKGAIATGEYPAPPQLFEGKGVTDDPAGETYWKAENGIRLTGMPAFGKSLSNATVASQPVAGQRGQVAGRCAADAGGPFAGRSGSARSNRDACTKAPGSPSLRNRDSAGLSADPLM